MITSNKDDYHFQSFIRPAFPKLSSKFNFPLKNALISNSVASFH